MPLLSKYPIGHWLLAGQAPTMESVWFIWSIMCGWLARTRDGLRLEVSLG
jgi:hypothetical protein